jgi:DNA-binding NarL/FixJ family response regulator
MKAIIADDQAGVRSALRLLIEQRAVCCTIIEAADAESLLSEVICGCPDIILLDVELAGIAAVKPATDKDTFQRLITQLRDHCPSLGIIALSSHPDVRARVISSGVNAFVCKTEPPEILMDVLDRLCP